jgi:sRNA-binding regulator protein Hfq
VFAPTLGAELDKAFTDLIQDLRTQYLLAYYPKDVPLTKNRFHRLEVRVGNPQLRVSARNGYYGEAEGNSSSPSGRISVSPESSIRSPSDIQDGWKIRHARARTYARRRQYLKRLIEQQTPVRVRLSNNEEVEGIVEYYDASFIRITRKGEPNLFIFKHDIKYLIEAAS